jgi:hypothetical protein
LPGTTVGTFLLLTWTAIRRTTDRTALAIGRIARLWHLLGTLPYIDWLGAVLPLATVTTSPPFVRRGIEVVRWCRVRNGTRDSGFSHRFHCAP